MENFKAKNRRRREKKKKKKRRHKSVLTADTSLEKMKECSIISNLKVMPHTPMDYSG